MSTIALRNFAGGELDPKLHKRVNLQRYGTSLKTLRNGYVGRDGGVMNRPGTHFIGESLSDSTRMIRFQYQDTEIVLLFETTYLRWVINGSLAMESAKAISAISKASPGIVSSTTHGYSNGDYVRLVVAGMYELTNRDFIVAGVTADTFTLTDLQGNAIDTSAFNTFTSGSAYKHRRLAHGYLSLDYLKFAQAHSFANMTLVHPLFPPKELAYTGTTFTLTAITFAPTIAAPVITDVTGLGTGGIAYVVTSVDALTGEESIASNVIQANAFPSSGAPYTIGIAEVTGASHYRVYRRTLNTIITGYGYIGAVAHAGTGTTNFKDAGTTVQFSEDFSQRPPVTRSVFASGGNYPSCVAFQGSRQFFANSINEPHGLWGSRVGLLKNFHKLAPVVDDDSVKFLLAGNLGKIVNILDAGRLLLLTDRDEKMAKGNDAGIITPTEVNIVNAGSSYGSDELMPIQADNFVLFLQRKNLLVGSGNIIRDLGFEWNVDGYRGNDLTAFARHLFRHKKLVSWAYARDPHSIVWAVRDDGTLLSLTYLKEHQIFGWARHDTDGKFLRACTGSALTSSLTVSTGGFSSYVDASVEADIPHFLVARTINGVERYFYEKMASREYDASSFEFPTLGYLGGLRDAVFMDGAVTYDGRDIITPGLDGGTTWDEDDSLTLTDRASGGLFKASDVGKEVHLYEYSDEGELEETYRLTITAYTNANTVTVNPDRELPEKWRSQTIASISESLEATIFIADHGLENGDQIFIKGCLGLIDLNNTAFIVSDAEEDSFKIKDDSGNYVDTSASGTYLGSGEIEFLVPYSAKCENEITGLSHHEGKRVAVVGDGAVVASPNNFELVDDEAEYAYEDLVVEDGRVEMEGCYAVIHAGLPYLSDFQTLPLDFAESETLSNKKTLINEVTLALHESKGGFIGPGEPPANDPLKNMSELKVEEHEEYDELREVFSGDQTEVIQGEYNKGSVFIRQVDPLPIAIQAIIPSGLIPAGKGIS